MILRDWAERLHGTPAPPAGLAALHVGDAVAAFLAGLRTREGQALARLFRDEAGPAARAGAMAGIIRLTECDDIHLPSCVTPGAVVVPVALALARTAEARARSVAAGTAAGLRLGGAIGGAGVLPSGVWPTLYAAPLMAAVAASVAHGQEAGVLAHAMALALAGTAARIGRPAGGLPGRWFLLAEAVARGVRAAEAAGQGIQGDLSLLSEDWLAASAVPGLVDLSGFAPGGAAPGLAEVGFKPFAGARQGINAVLAFCALRPDLPNPGRIEAVQVGVPGMNVALLSRPAAAGDRLGRMSNLGLQLAYAALAPEQLYDAERGDPPTPEMVAFASRVAVRPAPELEASLPDRWAARVVVRLAGGRSLEHTMVRMPFDADAPDLPERLHEKWRRLLPPGLGLPTDAPGAADFASLWGEAERCADGPPGHQVQGHQHPGSATGWSPASQH